jgi:phage repressor protein C with HTH and peptisase S24 domain
VQGKNLAGISRQAGLNATYLRDILKKNATPTLANAQKLSERGLNVPITEWFLAPETTPVAEQADSHSFARDVPIREGAQCGENDVFDFESQTADFAPRPPRLAGVHDAYALYVRGDSMEPWREHGQLVYVHPGVPARINDFVVVQLKPKSGGMPPAYLKRLVGRTSREIRLLQYNPRKHLTFPLTQILAIHRVMDPVELLGA